MKILLDTHAFLWFIDGNPKLSTKGKQSIENMQNERFLSVASLWEMSIKSSIGKLNLKLSFQEIMDKHVLGNAINLLQIYPAHLEILRTLPFHHKDPFDRLLIAQSQAENIVILSNDEAFDKYHKIIRSW